ncbi:MAG: fatty acid desaturase, partial [Flavobacteriaceae bacterium]|nr:fatty acid desaturase [Flavobacteriaceae bacterium]
MNTLNRPTFKKTSKDDFFKKMIKEVNEKVLQDKTIQKRNILKAVFL